MQALLLLECTSVSGFRRRPIASKGGNYHTKYAREAKPYSNIKFSKQLGYVPRYRYALM